MKIAYNPLGSTVLTVSPSENDITFDLPGKAIWTKGVKFGWYTTFSKDTSTASGYSGLVPAPNYNDNSTTRFLREDGKWIIPTNTTYSVVSSTANGLTPKVINTNTATVDSTYYVLSSKNGSAVPSWYKLPATTFANDNTTYTLSGALNGNTFVTTLTPSSGDTTAATVPVMTAATSSAAGTAGLVPAPEANKHTSFLRGDGTWSALNTSNIIALTNYSKATTAGDLETSDSLNTALGKLEYKTNIAYNWYKDITNTDTDEVINKWSEVVSFLNGVTNSESILNKFITTDTTQTITGLKTFNNHIVMGTNHYIYGSNEDGGSMLYFDGKRTILGSTTSNADYTHIRSKEATVTIGAGNDASYKVLHSGNYTDYITTSTFPGLNSTGTITGVSAGTGLSGGGNSGKVTLNNTGVLSTSINGNYLLVNTGGTEENLTIPYAVNADNTNKVGGLYVHTTEINNEANKIVRTDNKGDIKVGKILGDIQGCILTTYSSKVNLNTLDDDNL